MKITKDHRDTGSSREKEGGRASVHTLPNSHYRRESASDKLLKA